MSLKDLVRLHNNVQQLSTEYCAEQITKTFAEFAALLQHCSDDRNVDLIYSKQQQIIKLLAEINTDTSAICNNLKNQISAFDQLCSQKTQEIYNDARRDGFDYLQPKNIEYFKNIPKDIRQIALNKIRLHLNWKYPAMEIRPCNTFITRYLVANDPLYLVDTSESMFGVAKTKWNATYQRRLRYYTINEQDPQILNKLPDNQFGLVIITHFFEFRTLTMIQQYLQEIYNKLRPGGTVIFTINDCDYPEGVENFENIYYSYTPGHRIIKECSHIGYIFKEKLRLTYSSSWFELQKPGVLTALRSAQTLGKIINI